MPSYYAAEARVLVGVTAPRVLTSEAIITDANPDVERVRNEGFILQSRILAKRVIDQLNLVEDPNFNSALHEPSLWWQKLGFDGMLPAAASDWLTRWFPEPIAPQVPTDSNFTLLDNQMIDILLSRVDVSMLGRSHVLSIKAEARDPSVAAAIANAFASTYLDYQRGEKLATLDRVDKFLLGRVAELREQVSRSDQAVEDYRRMHGLYKSAGAGSGVTAQQLTELNTQLMAAQTAKAQIDLQLAEALDLRKEGLGKESVPEVLHSTLIISLKQQQAIADRKAAEMNAMYGERHPALRGANAEAATAQAKVGDEVSKTIDSIAREARAADVRYQKLSQEFENLKEHMGVVNDRLIGLDALERDAVINRNLLQLMLNRVKQGTGTDVFMQANARLVSPAVAPEDPSSPPKSLITVLGTLAGLMFGSAIVLLRQGGDATFRRADEIEATTGFPLFAMVPQTNARTVPSMQVVSDPASTFSEAAPPRAGRNRPVCGSGIFNNAFIRFSHTFRRQDRDGRFARPDVGIQRSAYPLDRLRLAASTTSPGISLRQWNRSRRTSHDDRASPSDIIHHDALSGCDVLTAGDWKPATSPFVGIRTNAPADPCTRDALRFHYPRHGSHPCGGGRSVPFAIRPACGLRGALGSHAEGCGTGSAEADYRCPGSSGRRGADPRREQKVPAVWASRPILRVLATVEHERDVTSADSTVRGKAHSPRWSAPSLLDRGRQVVTKAPTPDRAVDGFDIALIVLFLVGLYLGVSLQITSKIPLTSALAGFAGLIMLWRRRAQMKPEHLGGLLVILSLYAGSILSASNVSFLDKRVTGLLQLTYSLVIGYGLFLTMIQANRQQVAAVLLAFCCCIVAGCALETYGGLRPLSDKARAYLYSYDLVYNSDRRDEVLYGRIRPKLFTSEPSAVTFAYTYLSSVWLVICSWRSKYLVYVGLIAAGLVLLPGPTLVLMLLLVVPYFLFLSEGEKRNSPARFIGMSALSGIVVVSAALIVTVFFAERIRELQTGGDASFFYRFTGPMLVAFDMFRHHPMAGSGLTGEPSIVDQVTNVYMNSPSFQHGLASCEDRRFADQLFLVALDLPGIGLGDCSFGGLLVLAAPAGSPKHHVLLRHMGDHGPGVRRLRGAQNVGGSDDRRRFFDIDHPS